MRNIVFIWEQRFQVSIWPQNCKHYFSCSKTFSSINKLFHNKRFHLFSFLKLLINDLIKPIGYPASKYFFLMIETSASKSEAILKARCKSPFILFLFYLLGIVGWTLTFSWKENSGSVLYCTKESCIKWSVRVSFFVIVLSWYYLNVTLFILRYYQRFIAFFF